MKRFFNKTRWQTGFVFSALILVLAAGCGSDNPFSRGPELTEDLLTPLPGETVSFSADIVPALSVCASCHSSGAGGWTYNGAYSSVLEVINKSDPQQSELLINGTGGAGHGGGRLFSTTSLEYQAIIIWIEQGASNN